MASRRVGGRMVDEVVAYGSAGRATALITRPANQTPYSAGDVIGDVSGSGVINLSGVAPLTGSSFQIQSIRLLVYSATLPTGNPSMRLHLYMAQPGNVADNAAWDLVANDRAAYIDSIDLPPLSDYGSTLFTKTDYPGGLMRCLPGSSSVFGFLTVLGAATFAENSTVLDLRVNAYGAGV